MKGLILGFSQDPAPDFINSMIVQNKISSWDFRPLDAAKNTLSETEHRKDTDIWNRFPV
ncbi:MAG TPA: hypothetical protein VFD35_02280 [Pricia sp.]|nr:hypothetical protein [Pricia sp.]